VALLFALIVGAVLLRPVLSVNADGPNTNSQITISDPRQDGSTSTESSPVQLGDDEHESDDGWNGTNVSNRVIGDDHENEHEDDD
jgi:hypothetical protein